MPWSVDVLVKVIFKVTVFLDLDPEGFIGLFSKSNRLCAPLSVIFSPSLVKIGLKLLEKN